MTRDDKVLLTNGKGQKSIAKIVDDNRKRCTVQVLAMEGEDRTGTSVCIAISIIKNASRFEWFLEKATEIGVGEIIPLLCERTEKEKFRHDRMQNILIQRYAAIAGKHWLPVLHQPTPFNDVVNSSTQVQKFIAHCLPGEKQQLSNQPINQLTNQLILIGPEGDFTRNEIDFALEKGFAPVALGDTRLRTETAGIVAATLLQIA